MVRQAALLDLFNRLVDLRQAERRQIGGVLILVAGSFQMSQFVGYFGF